MGFEEEDLNRPGLCSLGGCIYDFNSAEWSSQVTTLRIGDWLNKKTNSGQVASKHSEQSIIFDVYSEWNLKNGRRTAKQRKNTYAEIKIN